LDPAPVESGSKIPLLLWTYFSKLILALSLIFYAKVTVEFWKIGTKSNSSAEAWRTTGMWTFCQAWMPHFVHQRSFSESKRMFLVPLLIRYRYHIKNYQYRFLIFFINDNYLRSGWYRGRNLQTLKLS
jgi:hypothetical protein